MAVFYRGDCLGLIKNLPDKSINLIYFNPPFATTENDWDTPLNWPELFKEFFRVLKPNGMIAIHCAIPFNYTLIRASCRDPSYSWYWDKMNNTCPMIARKQPLRQVEEILVWKNKQTTYYPDAIRVGTEQRTFTSRGTSSYYGATTIQEKQTVVGRYQTHLIEMKAERRGFSTRPESLIELILKAYTVPGDTVLDPTCYHGICGKVAKRLGRKWIGFDKKFYPTKLLCNSN